MWESEICFGGFQRYLRKRAGHGKVKSASAFSDVTERDTERGKDYVGESQ